MRVVMLQDVYLLGQLRLFKGHVYTATVAVNQPDFESKGLYFVQCAGSTDSILCTIGEDFQKA